MCKFFINRPIVAMVIAILMVLLGIVAMLGLPVAQYPDIAPPEIQLSATYPGADALTLEQSVATPIEQQMSGVDYSLYVQSINDSSGTTTMKVGFDVATDPNTDQILAQMRYSQAESQLPADVRNYGVTIKKATSSPLALFALSSPNKTYDSLYLANYAMININDPMSRVPGVGQVTIFGAGQYAIRLWVKPDLLARLNVTATDVVAAINAQNTVNPSGKIGDEPIPPGQEFTYTVRSQGRLVSEEEFGNIIVKANPDGTIIHVRDVGDIELGAQVYNRIARLNGNPAAVIAIYQLPGANAINTMKAATALMEEKKAVFPDDMEYTVSLDTTLAVTEGINEIVKTLGEALVLVIIVVFLFLQNWRATLIPLLAVPVSLVGAFVVFPVLGFSINTLSLFGLVLAIGLVVDDAIVVVEAVEHHIEEGMSPKDAALKAMEEVAGPVVAIALILAAVFIPTAFIPGITGRLYQQFAVTIAISVIISAFNALSLSPALAALILRPRKKSRGPLAWFFGKFNIFFERCTNGYIGVCKSAIRKTFISLLLLVGVCVLTARVGGKLPSSFLPEEDQGFFYLNVQLPAAASLQRSDAFCGEIEQVLKNTPGIAYYTTVVGYSLLSQVTASYNAFYFISLKPWSERRDPELVAAKIIENLNRNLAALPTGVAFAIAPPAIPGIGTSGGITFILEDRAGKDITFLDAQTQRFMAEARKRPEFATLMTTLLADTPQMFAEVDKEKVMKQGVDIADVYKALQVYMGGAMVNLFNRFGRTWQVYVQADGAYRKDTGSLALFYVRNSDGDSVPLSALVNIHESFGAEFTQRYNGYRSAQINAVLKPGYTSQDGMAALEKVFHDTMSSEMGFDYAGMSLQEYIASKGIPSSVIFGLSLLAVFLILAAQYESWMLPFSVLLGTPVAVFGAFLALRFTGLENNVYAQIGLVMLIGLAAKNAILIVEFAKMEYDRGESVFDAAIAAAKLRLRPILMTAFAFILGVMPLVTATGAGGISRRVLGSTVLGGMLAATFLAIFIIPVSYTFIMKLAGNDTKKEAVDQAKKIASLIAVLAVPLFLAGCKLGPDYKRPDVETPEEHRAAVTNTPASIADLPWWQVFNDATLSHLIPKALLNNYDLDTARANLTQARIAILSARADALPQLSGDLGLARESTFQIRKPYNFYNALLSATWELDIWGRIARNTEAAQAYADAAEAEYRGTLLLVTAQVAQSWNTLLALDRQYVIATNTAQIYTDTLKLFTERYEGKVDDRLSVESARASLANTRATVQDILAQIAAQENALCLLLGEPPASIARAFPPPPVATNTVVEIPAGLPSQLLQRRPDILMAEGRLHAASALIGAAYADFFPRLGLTAGFGSQSAALSDFLKSKTKVWNIGGDISAPIFQGGRLAAQYASQKAAYDGALADYKKTVTSAFGDVATTLERRTRLILQAEQYDIAVRALREAVNLSLQRYTIGKASYYEVLQAQEKLFPAETAFVQVSADLTDTTIQLYLALGGGWRLPASILNWLPPNAPAEEEKTP